MRVPSRCRQAPLTTCLAATLALVLACPGSEPEPGEDCPANRPEGPLDALPSREVEVGNLQDGQFEPWVEGGPVPVSRGGQGFDMLTPAFRLLGAGADPQRACYWVELRPVTETGEPSPDGIGWFEGGLIFEGKTDTRLAGPIYSPLDFVEVGAPVYFELTVASEDFAARQSIAVRLER